MSDVDARAEQAKRLLADDVLQSAFDDVREAAIDVWRRTAAADVQQREIAWMTVKVLDRIRGELENVVTNGKIAAARVQNPLR